MVYASWLKKLKKQGPLGSPGLSSLGGWVVSVDQKSVGLNKRSLLMF